MMDDESRSCQLTEVDERASQSRQSGPQLQNTNTPRWSNGQCVSAVPCNSMLNPTFDLSICRAMLERDGFQIPVEDFEVSLGLALDVPSVRRYMTFNSALFHFMLAPVLYVVLWCAAFSTFHLYLTITDYWVLCLSVSLISIFLTTAIIFILHHSNKEINVNVDVRLIQVNERMSKHNLLVGVADWVQNCSGNLQLMCVYWDMSCCLRTLTETLEESSSVANNTQNKLKERMSHLTLVTVTKVKPVDPVVRWSGEVGGSEEERPLLTDNREETENSSSSNQRDDSKITTNYSLVPETTSPAQVKAHQLLMTYSATYVRLLMSGRLSGPSPQRLRPRKNHCSVASLCLCQYINTKILQ